MGRVRRAAVLFHVLTGWAVAEPRRRGWLPLVAGGVGVVTVVAAVVVMADYAEVFLGPLVPAVRPSLGPGGPVAVLAALVSLAAVAAARSLRFSRSR